MIKQTVKRVQQEVYTSPPPIVVKTLIRWVLTDPAYQKRFLRYLCRATDPRKMVLGPTPGPIIRGLLRDIARAASRLPVFGKQMPTHSNVGSD